MKIFSILGGLFLGFFLSWGFAIWQSEGEEQMLTAQLLQETEALHAVPLEKKVFTSEMLIDLPEDQKQIFLEVLSQIPASHYRSLKKVVADTDPKARRGLASFKSLYLGINSVESEEELRRVIIHELGHVLDLGGLRASAQKIDSGFRDGSNVIYESDASLDFYRICWEDQYTQNGSCKEQDFVSQYAQTDVFEDFAESYLLFTENNASFLEMAQGSEVIAQKYDFFAQKVFHGEIPQTSAIKLSKGERVWDLTKVW